MKPEMMSKNTNIGYWPRDEKGRYKERKKRRNKEIGSERKRRSAAANG